MYATTGLVMLCLIHSAARSSSEPPISPIIMTAFVSGSSWNAAETVDEVRPGHRVATDAHARGLADALDAQFVKRLVGQRARSRHDAHRPPGQGDVAGRDADVALAGTDDARAVRSEQSHAGKVLDEPVVRDGLVVGRDALGDAHDEGDPALGRLDDRVDANFGGTHDERRASLRSPRPPPRTELKTGTPSTSRAPLSRRDAGHDLGAVVAIAQAVESPLAAR